MLFLLEASSKDGILRMHLASELAKRRGLGGSTWLPMAGQAGALVGAAMCCSTALTP